MYINKCLYVPLWRMWSFSDMVQETWYETEHAKAYTCENVSLCYPIWCISQIWDLIMSNIAIEWWRNQNRQYEIEQSI